MAADLLFAMITG